MIAARSAVIHDSPRRTAWIAATVSSTLCRRAERFAAAVAADERAALTEARARLLAAGAQASAGLLRRIAQGTADPDDPDVRRRCADEERYLRQLLAVVWTATPLHDRLLLESGALVPAGGAERE